MHASSRRALELLLAATVALGATLPIAGPALAAGGGSTAASTASTYTFKRASGPNRTLVYNASKKLVATFTDGARSVTLAGPSRTFSEAATTSATLTTTTWVRLLPSPFAGTVDTAWLTARLADTSPDELALAFQYTVGAPVITSAGLQIAGDADYGPLLADGTRQEGSDFNDYLGVTWTYADGSVDAPETAQIHALDCSGFVRMLLGYRMGVPMSLTTNGGASLPRRAVMMDASAPGIMLITNSGSIPSSRSKLQPGDLVFFDASTDDGTAIDHVGIYLGRDSQGHDRFISSRKTANGPTMGDLGGKSILDGTGYYASAFRSTRRV